MELQRKCCFILEPWPVSGIWKELYDAMGLLGRILTETSEISMIQRSYTMD